jgi:hypothetical protein
MKKLVALLFGAGLIAGSAQADLLASWSTVGLGGEVTNEAGTGVVVSDLSLFNGAVLSTTTNDVWAMNNLTVTGRGLQFTITSIAGGQQIENAVVDGTYFGSGTGPRQMDWFVAGVQVPGESIIRTVTTQVSIQNTLGTLNSGDVITLRVDAAAGSVRSGTAEAIGTAGSFRIPSAGMSLSGDVIPEPGTLGLLVLGTLGLFAARSRMKK